ncbi:MAG: hypothetical protein H6969_01170 [Gammaproteobacteria bacterium]|nr:hypothetical protein [Gammaproteobacteria bacterium]
MVTVQVLGQEAGTGPTLVFISSHCVGLDYLLTMMQRQGSPPKPCMWAVWGLAAARRGECDIASLHLMDRKQRVTTVIY